MLSNREISSKNVLRNFSRSALKNQWLHIEPCLYREITEFIIGKYKQLLAASFVQWR